jgi:hypothetical protein
VKGLYERIVAEGDVEDKGNITVVSGLAEDLQDMLLEHLVSASPKTPIQTFGR